MLLRNIKEAFNNLNRYISRFLFLRDYVTGYSYILKFLQSKLIIFQEISRHWCKFFSLRNLAVNIYSFK